MAAKKKRVVIDLHADESIANQIAHAEIKRGGSMDNVRHFLNRADRCENVDQLLRVILSDYDVRLKDEL